MGFARTRLAAREADDPYRLRTGRGFFIGGEKLKKTIGATSSGDATEPEVGVNELYDGGRMENLLIAVIAGLLILLASVASVELGVSVALIEISFGVVAGNFLGLTSPPWMDFLASFGSILLTFLAGAEVDPRVMREKLKESVLIGGVSFAAPFFGAWLFCAWVLGWPGAAAQIAGVALSTTSLAVVYAVLVETGLTLTPLGKLIMASTFVTDFGTALAWALLFVRPTWWLVPFLGVSVLVIWAMLALQPWFFSRYGERVIEPEIKGAVAALLVLMFFAEK